ncbi:di-heme oxidoredictase family protein [Enterovirga aerilata]|uniref:Cytochrome c domain-containing protein n=1 Tax=Enterovirga aerilata TaxID=2730920 RepID=A0A849IHK4_9HYPH|nr:di-heme oxidoredictase family protein [Enterovirga sp. DB1703]NNM73403.1 hypothetical protein [Enterovirga sp. DB1703]
MRRALAAALLAVPIIGSAAFAAGDFEAAIGRALFRRAWVPAPSSTRGNDGLGPLHNARSCQACHGGLGRTPPRLDADGTVVGEQLVLRFSDADGRPDPVYGAQMQTRGLPGVPGEGFAVLAGGSYGPQGLTYGPLAPSTRAGARLAPPLLGLGGLEQIPEAAILAIAQEQARGGDGVRGRPNWTIGKDGARRLGRFGLKASAATLAEQVETAFALDLGMSTPGRDAAAGDCTPAQEACLSAPHGGQPDGPEITADLVRLLAGFLATRPAPAAPPADPDGAAVFRDAGCASCHRPALPSPGGPVAAYTDLLLHDLGPGLDGGATEPGVAPTEWRTAPLWGVSRTLAAGAGLLHDGRARTVAEAIDLHGGEGAAARARFRALPPADRERLLAFVSTL